MIDEKEVTAYVTMPDCFLQGCSEDIVIFRADGGNHFTDYGIYEGMFLYDEYVSATPCAERWLLATTRNGCSPLGEA